MGNWPYLYYVPYLFSTYILIKRSRLPNFIVVLKCYLSLESQCGNSVLSVINISIHRSTSVHWIKLGVNCLWVEFILYLFFFFFYNFNSILIVYLLTKAFLLTISLCLFNFFFFWSLFLLFIFKLRLFLYILKKLIWFIYLFFFSCNPFCYLIFTISLYLKYLYLFISTIIDLNRSYNIKVPVESTISVSLYRFNKILCRYNVR